MLYKNDVIYNEQQQQQQQQKNIIKSIHNNMVMKPPSYCGYLRNLDFVLEVY